MTRGKKILVVLVAIIAVGIIFYFVSGRDSRRASKVKQIKMDEIESQEPLNTGPVSPISGLPCDNWNRRPIAVMQPSDTAARPASGFSEADMVIEMPVITAVITRLMGVYVCNNPEEVGSMRSARHDFVHLAKGLDAIFVHWGRSQMEWFIGALNEGVIDNMNCNSDAGKSANGYCFRHPDLVGMHSGYMKFQRILDAANDFGYRMENKFSGYSHKAEKTLDERPQSGRLRVAFARPYDATYEYDRETNSYLRFWGGQPDTDRNNGERISPKNIAVLIAKSEQIEGQYNNVELGDPWMDVSDSGTAYYYMNGEEIEGTWKKDKGNIASKLMFFDSSGNEISFVPGQIWVEILEPGQTLKWEPVY